MKKLLIVITALSVAFCLGIPNRAFGRTKSKSETTQKKAQGQGDSAKTQVIPTISKGKIFLDGKIVKELTLKDGTRLDAAVIKKDSKKFKVEQALLKYNGQVVQSIVLNNGSSTRLIEECSCYPPIPPIDPDPLHRPNGPRNDIRITPTARP